MYVFISEYCIKNKYCNLFTLITKNLKLENYELNKMLWSEIKSIIFVT